MKLKYFILAQFNTSVSPPEMTLIPHKSWSLDALHY